MYCTYLADLRSQCITLSLCKCSKPFTMFLDQRISRLGGISPEKELVIDESPKLTTSMIFSLSFVDLQTAKQIRKNETEQHNNGTP